MAKPDYNDENDLNSGVIVIWQGKAYTTGNRRHNLVELFKDGKLSAIAEIKELRRMQDK